MKLNNLFIEDDSAYIFVSKLFEMDDLVDEKKLNAALTEYFND